MAGSTNFLQWNPSQINQETDAEYAADSQRAGGAVDPSPFLSLLGNKCFYQWSTFIAAFGQMMSVKGYSVSDANISTLATVLANLLTNADIPNPLVSVPFSPAPVFNAAVASGWDMILSGNVTAPSLVGTAPGKKLVFVITQDSVGGRTFAWPSNVKSPGTPDPGPNAVSIQEFFVRIDGTIRPLGPMTVS